METFSIGLKFKSPEDLSKFETQGKKYGISSRTDDENFIIWYETLTDFNYADYHFRIKSLPGLVVKVEK